MKTIINDSPVNMLSIYVDQRFKHRGDDIDQYSLIDRIRAGSSVVITGTGGGGKSVFMRYLWLSFFEKSSGKLPLFFELRQVNSVSHPNFVDYLFHSILQTRSSISRSQFDNSLHSGEIVLFLDGFDEINLEKRPAIEREIIALRENNPKLVVVLTSRPDERFDGWQQFDSVAVEPLTEDDVEKLISRAVYDEASKRRLLKRIKGGLYKTHSSFLSNPLLAYMMLLTIARNPDIPSKMHAFYEMAFDALYHRHDTSKGGFIREFYSSFDKQQFTKYLSYLCLITYHDETYEANEQVIADYVEKALSFDGSDDPPAPFLRDLVESVCVLRKDGTVYSFIHRSFQEYFAAVCICRFASRNLEKLFAELSKRYNDQVLKMVYDINGDLFREKYVVPLYQRHKNYLDKKGTRLLREDYLARIEGVFEARQFVARDKRASRREVGAREIGISLEGHGELYSLMRAIHKVGAKPEAGRGDREGERKRREDEHFFSEAAKLVGGWQEPLRLTSDGRRFSVIGQGGQIVVDGELLAIFKRSNMYEYLAKQAKKLREFVAEERSKYALVTSSFEEYF